MSDFWDKPEYQEEKTTDPDSIYLGSAIGDGDSMTLKFIDLFHQEQEENAKYPTADGKVWMFFFNDEEGKERQLSQNSQKGMLFRAMREAKVDKEEVITLHRKGLGKDTEWTITRGDETPAVEAEKKADIPF